MRADLERKLRIWDTLLLKDCKQLGSCGDKSTLQFHLVGTSKVESFCRPMWLVNYSEDMIQCPGACHIHNTFQEDIFLLLHLRTAPWNPEFIKSMDWAVHKASSSPPGSFSPSPPHISMTAVHTGGSPHSTVRLNSHEVQAWRCPLHGASKCHAENF